MLENRLKMIGLKESETDTYLTLLDLGSSSAGTLSKRLNLPRATIYGYLEKLVSCGLVYQGLQNNTKIFIAEAPQKITRLFEKKINDLKKEKAEIQKLIPTLEKKVAHHFSRPKLQFFEGRNDLCHAMEDCLNHDNTIHYKLWAMKSAIATASPDFFDWHNRERIHKKIWSHTIWPRKQALNVQKHPYMGVGAPYLRHARLSPAEIEFKMGYWIYGDKVMMLSSLQESFAFIVESAEYAETMIAQHHFVWQHSKPVPDTDPAFAKRFFQDGF